MSSGTCPCGAFGNDLSEREAVEALLAALPAHDKDCTIAQIQLRYSAQRRLRELEYVR